MADKSTVLLAACHQESTLAAFTSLDLSSSIGYRAALQGKSYEKVHRGARAEDLPRGDVDTLKVFEAAIGNWPPSLYATAHDDPLMFFLPVLDIENTIMGGNLADCRYRMTDAQKHPRLPDMLEQASSEVRELQIEGGEPFHTLLYYDSDQNESRTQREQHCLQLYERHHRTMHQVNVIEQIARDDHQLHVARTGLEASRTSIR